MTVVSTNQTTIGEAHAGKWYRVLRTCDNPHFAEIGIVEGKMIQVLDIRGPKEEPTVTVQIDDQKWTIRSDELNCVKVRPLVRQ
jgi:Fe2+ transport system protein FeoA